MTAGSLQSPLDLAVAAGRAAGLDVSGAAVVRRRTSVQVELPAADALARVEQPGQAALSLRQVRIARACAQRGAPTVRLLFPDAQPFTTEQGSVTLWQRLRPIGPVTPTALGRTTRALHDATRGLSATDLPLADPFPKLFEWLEKPVGWLEAEDRRALRRQGEELSRDWERNLAADPLGVVLTHGDVHPDNAVVTAEGLILVDLEDSGIGPASWDFASMAAGARRYVGRETELEQIVAGYGADPTRWDGFTALCRTYELLVTVWAIACSDTSEQMRAEARLRVDGVLGRSDERWTLL